MQCEIYLGYRLLVLHGAGGDLEVIFMCVTVHLFESSQAQGVGDYWMNSSWATVWVSERYCELCLTDFFFRIATGCKDNGGEGVSSSKALLSYSVSPWTRQYVLLTGTCGWCFGM